MEENVQPPRGPEPNGNAHTVDTAIGDVYRTEYRRVLATLIRLLGDFDLAEEALQDAFMAAVAQWPRDGVPANPRAWLVSTGRFKGIDRIRRRARFEGALGDLAQQLSARGEEEIEETASDIIDDQLRLIFACCHPSLGHDARVALTLREVCGLTTEEIAQAFLTSPTTIAQRIVRAKAKFRKQDIPYEVPQKEELPDRLDAVLQVIYLVFNEGYFASSGESVVRTGMSSEAIRLARILLDLLPDAEVMGLLALMLLHDSRRSSRVTTDGEIILLEDQDRGRWDRAEIDEGSALIHRAMATRRIGPYTIQAAIAALHAEAVSVAETDWNEITGLYDLLLRTNPSPVVELNRAAAIAMRDGPEAALPLVDGILARGELTDYHLAHAARADLLRRLGRKQEARVAYEHALALASQAPERQFIERRLRELDSP